MKEIGLFWGSNTGNQEEAAGFLKDFMESEGVEMDEYNIADTDPIQMLEYKKLIKIKNLQFQFIKRIVIIRALSSVGRTLVSKIKCRGFKSFRARFSFLRGFYF